MKRSQDNQTEDCKQPVGEQLVNEAIKRILLDVILRGHGDRLVGRWSRQPELQQFLEQVPYLLDRINQLHLTCARVDRHEHHEHHYHHHGRQKRSDQPRQQDELSSSSNSKSTLLDFINLIGSDLHWLVRTRDQLGLTPLHKAILFNNYPIAEYILDRYSDEPAATLQHGSAPRLLDSQDKYGRTALHYAAAQLLRPERSSTLEIHKTSASSWRARDLYQFLVTKGASEAVRDFRGKTAAYYLRHPEQVRVRCILHLANKLNAQYQANLLTKTLKIAHIGPVHFEESEKSSNCERIIHGRESMSLSCGDLVRTETRESDPSSSQSEVACGPGAPDPIVASSSAVSSSSSLSSSTCVEDRNSEVLKRLANERCQKLVMDRVVRDRLKRYLSEGSIMRISELLEEGYGSYLVEHAQVECWNLQCRRYIHLTIPRLLAKLDALHECIASNQLLGLRLLLNADPQLARIRRPYKRAYLNALHLAVRLGRISIMRYLVDRFPELVNQPDSQGATCLHWAARNMDTDRIFNWLNKHFGYQLASLRDCRRKTALDYYEQSKRVKNRAKATVMAAKSNDFETISASQRVAAGQLKVEISKVRLVQRDDLLEPRKAMSNRRSLSKPNVVSKPRKQEISEKEKVEQEVSEQKPPEVVEATLVSKRSEPRRASSAEPGFDSTTCEIQKLIRLTSPVDKVNPECSTTATCQDTSSTKTAGVVEVGLEEEPETVQPIEISKTSGEKATSGAAEESIDAEDGTSKDDRNDQQLYEEQLNEVFSGSEVLSDESFSDNLDDPDDEDERVERLSNEFEDRIRKEKNELKVKVDQIMNEIKSSSKSNRSSRMLESPLLQKESRTDGEGSSSTTLYVGIRTQNGSSAITTAGKLSTSKIGVHRDQMSRSSSGNSSARSASSTHTSTLGSTCSSSSSSSFSTGTACDSPIRSISRSSSGSSCASMIARRSAADQLNVEVTDNKSLPVPVSSSAIQTLAIPKLEGGVQVVSKNTYGQTYLHFIASRSQSASTLYKVLNHASHLIGERDIFYRTARDVAMQFNLIVNVRVIDKFIIDLFIGANTSVLRHLLNQGYAPLIHVADPEGNDIMLILKLLKLDRMIHFLLQMADFQRWRDELHTFIRNGYSAGVHELVRKHKDLVQARSIYSRTSLHLAVLFDRVKMVEELIEGDPKCIQATDNMGRTALHYSYGLHLKHSAEIRSKLIQAGACTDLRDLKMRQPKYYYIFRREIEDIKHTELELN